MTKILNGDFGKVRIRTEKTGSTFFYNDNSYQANEQFSTIFQMLLDGKTNQNIENALREIFEVPSDANLFDDIDFVEKRCREMGINMAQVREGSEKDSVWPAPNFVDFNITTKCNMRCAHCYMGENEPVHFPTGKAVRLIRDLARMGTLKMALAGGEPLMHPDWQELLNTIVSSGMMAMINSNGTLFDDKLISDLRERYDADELIFAISLDGDSSEINSKQRPWLNSSCQEDSFAKTLRTIKMLTESGFQTCINFTVTKLNYKSVIHLYDMLSEQLKNSWENFKVLNLIKFGVAGSGIKNKDMLEMDYQTWRSFLVELTNEKKKGELTKLKIEPTCPWELLIPLHGIYSASEIDINWQYSSPLDNEVYSELRDIGCNAGISHICINPDGGVYPCGLYSQLKSYEVGNVLEQNISNLWTKSQKLKYLRSITLDELKSNCIACKFAKSCGGGCRGAALSMTGSLLGIDNRCPISSSRN